MIDNEWLNVQDAFVIFFGRWIVIYASVALASAIIKAILGLWWRRPQVVRLIGRDDDDI